eukprot:5862125-Pyramimonas_sp.AAC.1
MRRALQDAKRMALEKTRRGGRASAIGAERVTESAIGAARVTESAIGAARVTEDGLTAADEDDDDKRPAADSGASDKGDAGGGEAGIAGDLGGGALPDDEAEGAADDTVGGTLAAANPLHKRHAFAASHLRGVT